MSVGDFQCGQRPESSGLITMKKTHTMSKTIFTPTSIALVCSSLLTGVAMAAPTTIHSSTENTQNVTTGFFVNNKADNHFVFTNKGKIDASGDVHAFKAYGSHATIDAINNAENAQMIGKWHGISLEGQSSVQTINNSGLIQGNSGQGIYVAGESNVGHIQNQKTGTITGVNGIAVDSKGHVATISNAGTIKGNKVGINTYQSTVDSISTSGLVQGGNHGINIDQSKVSSIDVAKGGVVKSTGNSFWSYGDFGIHTIGSTVGKITNNGEISGGAGIVLDNSKVQSIVNNGTVTGTNGYAIYMSPWYGASHIENLTNTGKMEGKNGAGIGLEVGTSIGNLTTSGQIVGSRAGITTIAQAHSSAPSQIGTITVQNNGVIEGKGTNGIELFRQDGKKMTTIGTINVEQGGTVKGNHSGMWFQNGTGVGTINIAGKVVGNTAGIYNDGQIDKLTVAAGGELTSDKQNFGLTNSSTGVITSGVDVAGTVSGASGGIRNMGSIFSQSGGNAMQVTGTVSSIDNSGRIDSLTSAGVHAIKVAGENATVSTINNNKGGQITGAWHGVSIENGAHVGGISNVGTITGNKGAGVYVNNATLLGFDNQGTIQGSQGVFLQGKNTTVMSFNNTGTILGQLGVNIDGAHVENGELGNVTGTSSAVYIQNGAQINNLSVASGKSITGGKWTGGPQSFGYAGAGIRITDNASVDTLSNAGDISGAVGLAIQKANVGTLNNSGTIQTSTNNGLSAALYLISWYGKNTVGTINNTGTIKSAAGYGVLVEPNTTINDFTNAGTIQAGQSGIWTVHSRNSKEPTYIANLNLEKGSKIIAGNSGIRLTSQTNQPEFQIGNLNAKAGSTITAQNGDGIYVDAHSGIKSVKVDGTITANKLGFVNHGVVGESGNKGDAITIGSTGVITSQTAYALRNTGTINGNLTIAGQLTGKNGGVDNSGTITGNLNYSGNKDLVLNNTGKVAGKFNVTGSGNVLVKNWNVYDENSKAEIEKAKKNTLVKVEKVTFANSGTVGKALAEGRSLDTSALAMVNGQYVDVDSVGLSNEIMQLGIQANEDKDNKKLDVKVVGANTSGGLLGQALSSQLMRRDFFVNSMVDEAVNSTQYHGLGGQSVTSVFAKPYGSYDKYDAGSASMTGNTYGILVGANYLKDGLGATAYAGYEHGDVNSDFMGGKLGLKADTFYLGATGYTTVASFGSNDVFVKAGAKAAFTKNDLDRALENTNSQAKTDAMSWGANAQAGVNFKLAETSIVTPTIGVGYSSAKIDDFTLMNGAEQKNADMYTLGNVNMPYGEVALNWQQGWTQNLRTTVGGGVRVLFDKTQDVTATLSGQATKANYDLSGSYEYVTANAAWTLDKNNEVSVGYTGVFEGSGQSHNLTAKYEYLF